MIFHNILVATDGTDFSSKAVRLAAQLARACGCPLTAIHALQTRSPSDMQFLAEVELRHEAQASADRSAREIAETVTSLARDAQVDCEVVIDSGSPWNAIVRVAQERGCDLIVMASHGRSGASALLLGSETQKVLAHSKVPVLAVR